jgi:hypothetical protein
MMRFLAAISRAIKNTLGWMGGMIGTPINAFFASMFGPAPEPPQMPPMPAAEDLQEIQASTREAKRETAQRLRVGLAATVQTWALQSFTTGAHAKFPPAIPGAMHSWLRGLSREQLKSVGQMDSYAFAGHLTGDRPAAGLSSIRPLPVADIRRGPPDMATGSPSFSATLISEYGPLPGEPDEDARSASRRRRDRNRAPSRLLPAPLGMCP